MSFHAQNLTAFIDLLSDRKARLFSVQDRTELAAIVAALPDDTEKLSEAIANWYQKHPKILDAQLDAINQQSVLAASSRFTATANSNAENLSNKQALQEAIAIGKTSELKDDRQKPPEKRSLN